MNEWMNELINYLSIYYIYSNIKNLVPDVKVDTPPSIEKSWVQAWKELLFANE